MLKQLESMNDIKLICCDIDGTLVRDDKSLSDENVRWIQRAVKEKNVRFTIVSGRMYSAVIHFYSTLGVRGPASCINGALLYDSDGNVIGDHRISIDIAERIYRVAREFPIEMLLIAGNTWYTEKHDGFLYSVKLPIYRQDSVIADLGSLIRSEEANKILFMSQDANLLESLRAEIRKEIAPSDASFYYGNDFLELMPGGVNKGTAIDDLSAYYGIDKSEIMALGDDFNDIEMLSKAGFSIAMGNASDVVKSAARYVTDANENDGVARAIERFYPSMRG